MNKLIAMLALTTACSVANALEPYTCRNGLFPSFETIEYAEVSGDSTGRSYFYDDDKDCPQKESCKRKTYIIKGDKILVSELGDANWACVWYFGKKHEFVGLMNKKNLTKIQTQIPSIKDWVGTWRPAAGSNEIIIKALADGKLSVSGNAVWHGGRISNDYEVTHVGEFSGEAHPKGNRLIVQSDEYDCVVKFQLVQGNLAVTDNGNCGGANVRFDDVYRRVRP